MLFSLLDLFLAMGIGQGLILLVAIGKMGNAPKNTNRWLQGVIVLSMVMLLGRILFLGRMNEATIRLATFIDITIFLFGPLTYFYLRSILEADEKKVSLLHWIPAFIHLGFFIWTCVLPFEQLMEYANTGVLNLPFFIMEVTGLLSMTIYTIVSFKIFRNASRQSIDTLLNEHQSSFIRTLVYSMFTLEVFWLASFMETNFIRMGIPYLNYANIWILVPAFFFAFTTFGLFHPRVLQKPIGKTRFVERLSIEKKKMLEGKLAEWMQKKAVYLKADLTLTELADNVGVSANDLSWYINTVHKKNFYDLINEYRIRAFEEKVANDEHKKRTLLALAYEVGFNSKTTFNKVFKEFKQETPSQFVRRVEGMQSTMVA